jgi:hypothetical protein
MNTEEIAPESQEQNNFTAMDAKGAEELVSGQG